MTETETAFYLTCAAMLILGLILAGFGVLIDKLGAERVGMWVGLFGGLCGFTAIIMGAIGPRS
jgi:hypothetical protein